MESERKTYTAQEVIAKLKECGFKYTVHGLRKYLEMGCVPSYRGERNKKKQFSEDDIRFILIIVSARAISGLPLEIIKNLNKYLWSYEVFKKKWKEKGRTGNMDKAFYNSMAVEEKLEFGVILGGAIILGGQRLKAFDSYMKIIESYRSVAVLEENGELKALSSKKE